MRVGIALAAFQPNPGYFRQQLESVQAQTLQDWVCLISADSDLEPILARKDFELFRSEKRFIWSPNPSPLGHKKNFERAIGLAAAQNVDAIACSDQDDFWYPGKLARCVEELSKKPPLSLVHSDMFLIRTDGSRLPSTLWKMERRGIRNSSPEHLLVRNLANGCSILMDAELARRFPVIPEEFGFHDYWYTCVASFFGGVHAIDEPLLAYRQHGGNVIGANAFRGILAPPTASGERNYLQKCRSVWNLSSGMAQALSREGLALPSKAESWFLDRKDHGRKLAQEGFRQLWNDPPLARALLSRAVGKLLS